MPAIRFILRPESFCIHRLPPAAAVNAALLRSVPWVSVTRTEDELSVVAPEGLELGSTDREAGWSCLQISGTLDLGMVGIIAGISKILAEEGIPIFTISTYNTDYIFVRTGEIAAATRALEAAGHVVATADSRP
jgi:hypothetical protein